MRKKSLLLIILSLFSINIISAYTGSPLRNIFYRIDPNMLVSIILFIVFFALLNYVLSKVFRDKHGNVNTGTSVVISLCLSALIVYWANRSYLLRDLIDNLYLENLFLYLILGAIAIFVLWLIFRRKDTKERIVMERIGRAGRRSRRRRR